MANKYIRIHTLSTRGPIEGGPDRDVDGVLLSAEEPTLAFDAGHNQCGHDRVELWPAFHNGAQCWIESRRWVAAHGYSAWGTVSRIVPLEEGVRIMIDRGVFRLEPPQQTAHPSSEGWISGEIHPDESGFYAVTADLATVQRWARLPPVSR